MHKQTILFDLDDTLIHCNKYFFAVLEQFADVMTGWFGGHGLTEKEILNKQKQFDIAGVQAHGLIANRFPESLVETYLYYCELYGMRATQDEQQFLRKLGFSVYDVSPEPYPAIHETLDQLQEEGHRLCLYTGGERAIQLRKIKAAELTNYFQDRIYITIHKTTEYLQSLIRQHGFEQSRTWMIGNSVRTDVLPALENGIHAIHIRAELEWEFNEADIRIQPQGAFYQLHSLRQVPAAIESYSA